MTSATTPVSPGVDNPAPLSQHREQVLTHLQALLDGDVAEQQETFAYLQRVLGEDHLALHKRFAVS